MKKTYRDSGAAKCHTAEALAYSARAAQRALGSAPGLQRTRVLKRLNSLLAERRQELLRVNRQDIKIAARQSLAPALLQRLELTSAKLDTLMAGVDQIAASDDPVGRIQRHTELDDGLRLSQVSSPIGVLLVIFESRPDVVIQIGALAIRSGNALLLKGGSEALKSNQALSVCLRDALVIEGLSPDSVINVEGRHAVHKLLQCQSEIDLVIPRGSSQLVTSIQNSTRIPVLGHAEGICHLFLDAAADLDMAIRVAIDSKCDYPSACNSIETLLVHHEFLPSLPPVLDALRTEGVELRVDSVIAQSSPNDRRAQESDWSREYSDLVLSVRTVGSLDEAINHIHRYGSGHTEAIVTADEKAASAFLQRTDSASVFVNASTRFADGYRYGLGAEVGISTGRIHARGPVGIDALLTTRWLLSGRGQITADYSSGKRQFRHSELSCAGRKPSINPASIQ